VDTQQRASELTGCDVYFPRSIADESTEGPSLAMLVGFDIVDASNNAVVGKIASVDDTTQNILFELEDGRLIPASDDLIEAINTEQQTIKMNIPSGLLTI
jgi:16S rRNA processing protein RimM